MAFIIIAIVVIAYVIIAQATAYFGYKSCGRKSGECRNIACKNAKECLRNTFYNPRDCFVPEEDNPYPLCVGAGKEECKTCCLWANLPGPY